MLNPRIFRKNVLYLIGATRGGPTRARIMDILCKKPMNANQLAETLEVDYKTVRHHLDVLVKNNWLTSMGGGYGDEYKPTFLEEEKQVFNEVVAKLGKKL